jgi:2-polyprenyl-3-methyl-5-hydroxy-6-metoxy-1,4-benzoquinol methylase
MLSLLLSLLAGNLVGADMHNARYTVGYHPDLKCSHARGLIKLMINTSDIHTALDVGCSNGLAVLFLWERGLQANGVDISPVAMHLAMKPWLPEPVVAEQIDDLQYGACCVFDPCFLVSSATDLSAYPNGSFDTVLSTNVLEHLHTRRFILRWPNCAGCPAGTFSCTSRTR